LSIHFHVKGAHMAIHFLSAKPFSHFVFSSLS